MHKRNADPDRDGKIERQPDGILAPGQPIMLNNAVFHRQLQTLKPRSPLMA
jgi:hypothetical protein